MNTRRERILISGRRSPHRFAAVAEREERDAVGRLGYDPETVQQTSDRRRTWATPQSE